MVASGSISRVEPRVAEGWLNSGEAVMVDVREPDEVRRERIAGAQLAPMSRFDAAEVARGLGGGDQKRIVVVCRTGRRAADAADRLAEAGVAPVVLEGGIEAWKRAGLPVERDARAPLPIMRQVQIAAGSLVFAGTVLGATVSPWWLIVPGFVGAGLVFAGVTGTCGMATVLSAMPWNRRAAGSGKREMTAAPN